MTIIVFLVDTSASMQQKAFVSGKSTLLDVAKGAVEFFVKLRQKSPESRGDRYMLLTFEEYPKNIKAGWKENLQTFMNELKNLEANGMTTMGSALKQVNKTFLMVVWPKADGLALSRGFDLLVEAKPTS